MAFCVASEELVPALLDGPAICVEESVDATGIKSSVVITFSGVFSFFFRSRSRLAASTTDCVELFCDCASTAAGRSSRAQNSEAKSGVAKVLIFMQVLFVGLKNKNTPWFAARQWRDPAEVQISYVRSFSAAPGRPASLQRPEPAADCVSSRKKKCVCSPFTALPSDSA